MQTEWPVIGQLRLIFPMMNWPIYHGSPFCSMSTIPRFARYICPLSTRWRTRRGTTAIHFGISSCVKRFTRQTSASGYGNLERALERIPMDLVNWPVRNPNRKNLQFRQAFDRFAQRELTSALAPDERPAARWNSNPYYADGGGSGFSEDDGAFFLLPYWLGRYHHWIK